MSQNTIKELRDILINNNQNEDLDIADAISNKTGWCINSWDIESVNNESKKVVFLYDPDLDDSDDGSEIDYIDLQRVSFSFDELATLADDHEFPLAENLKKLFSNKVDTESLTTSKPSMK